MGGGGGGLGRTRPQGRSGAGRRGRRRCPGSPRCGGEGGSGGGGRRRPSAGAKGLGTQIWARVGAEEEGKKE